MKRMKPPSSRSTLHLVTLLLLVLALATACKSSRAKPATPSPLLDESERGPAWQKNLLPQARSDSREIALSPDVFAFDRIVFQADRAPAESEMMWLVIHATLDWLSRREATPPRVAQGYHALMAELEPGAPASNDPLKIEITFLSSKHRAGGSVQEALGVRLWRRVDQRIPTLTLVMHNATGSSRLPFEDVLVWSHPDLEGGEGSARIAGDCLSILKGTRPAKELGEPCPTGDMERHTAAIGSIQGALEGIIWHNLSGAGYVETPLREGTQDAWDNTLHPGLSTSLGIPRRDRDIEEVPSSTAFPPRIDIEELFTDSSPRKSR